MKDQPIALFAGEPTPLEVVALPGISASEHVAQDYAATSLSLKAHPVSFLREKLRQLHITATGDLKNLKDGDKVHVAGLVLVRQRRARQAGVCFMTIEDKTGFANAVIFQSLFEEYRKAILQSRLIMVEGNCNARAR